MITPVSLSPATVEVSAEAFRDRHAPGIEGRIDIEAILDVKLGIEIVAQDDLEARTGLCGFLDMDGSTIVVDTVTQTAWPKHLYEALLRHERGHAELHRDYLPATRPRSVEEFVAFHDGLSPERRVVLEWEARRWGRALCMPRRQVAPVFYAAVERAKDRFPALTRGRRQYVIRTVAEHFVTSLDLADLRLRELHLWKTIAPRGEFERHMRPNPARW